MIWAIALAASPADWSVLPAGVKPAIEDTYLDQSAADANFGRASVLISGPDKTILVRPANLSLMVPEGHKIKSASLTFTTSEPESPKVSAVGLTLLPWFEGAGRDAGMQAAPGTPIWGATYNHSRAGSGGARWSKSGAMGDQDRELVAGVTTSFELGGFTINNLGPALQKMLDNPGRYTGISFSTQARAQFISSEFGEFGPVFKIETEPAEVAAGPDLEIVEISTPAPMRTAFPGEGQSLSWEARIRNAGSQASGAATGQWQVRYGAPSPASVPALGPGEETVVKIDLPFRDQADKRFWPLSFRAELAGDVNPRNNFGEVVIGAIPLAVVENGRPANPAAQAGFKRLIEAFNNHVFPMSRFGFAPEGVTERLRFTENPDRAMAVVEASALDAAPFRTVLLAALNYPAAFFDRPSGQYESFNSIGLTPDTRDEASYLPGLAFPERLWPPSGFGQPIMPETGLLGRSEAALLMSLAGKSGNDRAPAKIAVSNILIVRTLDGVGRPLNNVKVALYQPKGGDLGAPLFTAASSSAGTILIPARSMTDKRESLYGAINPDGSNAWLYAEFESHGEKASRWIPWVQIAEEARRGGLAGTSLEFRMLLSDQPLDRTQNLVKGKVVEDSLQRFPAELGAVIDEDVKTSLDLPGEPSWIEIDLGRDRGIGEVQLVFEGDKPWESFMLQVYNTSQRPEQLRTWISEEFGSMRANVQGQPKDGLVRLRYLGGSTNARYLRILKRKGSAKLAEVIVHPVTGG